jgi:predicted CoA-substrate-specific enzyme activase
MSTMYFAGIDIGSTMTKIVIMDDKIRTYIIGPTGAEHRRLANKLMEEALANIGISFDDIMYVIATGYGRINVPFADKQVTEITCHARGVASIFPQARTVIDIGGQDAKGIKIMNGKVVNFVMNDKCAAGTGRFIEVIAAALGLTLKEMGELSLKAKSKVRISNTCTIFAEYEVVSKIADGIPLEDILAGLHDAIASRVYRMAEKTKIEREVVMTGGVAKNVGMVRAMQDQLGYPVLIAEEPLLTGAIGAAIIGREIVTKALERGETIEKGERLLAAASFFR